MSKLFTTRYLPILHIHQKLNPLRTLSLIQKIKKISTLDPLAIGIIVDIPNQMPVQVDKLLQQLKIIREQKNIPIYGFTSSKCSPQSYYLLSGANKIYTHPTTIFTFKKQITKLENNNFLEKFKINRLSVFSHKNLLGRYMDAFTSPDTIKYGNKKQTDITQRLIKYSLLNRQEVLKKINLNQNAKENYADMKIFENINTNQIQNTSTNVHINNNTNQNINFDVKQKQKQIQPIMLGKDLLQQNLVDGYGFYEQILRQKFPKGRILKLQYANENLTVLKTLAMVTSPILIILFLIKVAIKWSLIFYAWIKAKTMGNTNTNSHNQEDKQIYIKQN